jgi:hypothetical protein
MTEYIPEPVIKYVDFQTAAQHMLNGGRAKFMDIKNEKNKRIYFYI